MSKKIISLILSAMLTASMFGVAAVSASAQVDTSGQYTPGEGTETKRYYFMKHAVFIGGKAQILLIHGQVILQTNQMLRMFTTVMFLQM